MGTLINNLNYFEIAKNNTISKERIISVDALRGFDMFWIIGGKKIFKGLDKALDNSVTNFIYSQLDHAEWLGLTFYDIIMPLFLYLVGISMVYSFRKRLNSDKSKINLWKHIFIRIFWLWILGMMVQGKLLTYDINEIKLYSNTLQAIAAGYLISAIIILNFSVIKQIFATLGLLLIYWGIMTFSAIPEIGANNFLPENNFALFFDKLLLGNFQDGTTYTWIISSINFGVTTMLGVFSGYILQSNQKPLAKFSNLFAFGIALIIFGEMWSIWHPSIKHIWTSSFTLISGGICLILLSLFYFIIDVLNFKKWTTFFVIIGSNAIFAYVTAHVFDYRVIAQVFTSGLEKYTGDWYQFIYALGGFLVLFLILKFMNKNKIYVKI